MARKPTVPKIPRTYRIEEPILREMEKFREDFPLGPSDTTLVNAAIRQFLAQERQRLSAAYRGAGIEHVIVAQRGEGSKRAARR